MLLTLIFTLEMKKLCTLYTLLGMFFQSSVRVGRRSSSFPVDITINYLHYVQSITRQTKETKQAGLLCSGASNEVVQ